MDAPERVPCWLKTSLFKTLSRAVHASHLMIDVLPSAQCVGSHHRQSPSDIVIVSVAGRELKCRNQSILVEIEFCGK